MSRLVVLDTGVLGMVIHPRKHPEIKTWFANLREAGVSIGIPEIADYELRRELVLQGFSESVERLDALARVMAYIPLNTQTMRKAAEFWAEARKPGGPGPTADKHALDGDMILCAQAVLAGIAGDDAVIATTNVGHLSRFADARDWRQID